jgi:predicted nucleic acid-binding protein
MVLVDTNVILDIVTNDPKWFGWARAQLEPLINSGEAAINPIIYAELVPAVRTPADLDAIIVPPGDFLRLPLPYAAAIPAARAFAAYRRAGGAKTLPLPDFFIGAHAEVESLALLTRDPARYLTYFPEVKLIHP